MQGGVGVSARKVHHIRDHPKVKCCQMTMLSEDYDGPIQLHKAVRTVVNQGVPAPRDVAGEQDQEWSGAVDGPVAQEGRHKAAVVDAQEIVHRGKSLVWGGGGQRQPAAVAAAAAVCEAEEDSAALTGKAWCGIAGDIHV